MDKFGGMTNDIDTYYVNLKQETCACRKWDLTRIPCSQQSCHTMYMAKQEKTRRLCL